MPPTTPDLSTVKSCADVAAYTLRALADALEAAQLKDCGCSIGCCSCQCGSPSTKSAA